MRKCGRIEEVFWVESGRLVGYYFGNPVYECPLCKARIVKTKFLYLYTPGATCPHVVGLDDPEGRPLFSTQPEKARDLFLALEEVEHRIEMRRKEIEARQKNRRRREGGRRRRET